MWILISIVIVCFIIFIYVCRCEMRKHNKSWYWCLYHLSGVRLIWTKLQTENESIKGYIKPASFFLWVLGVLYFGAYNLASDRYKDDLNELKSKVSSIKSRLTVAEPNIQKTILSRIGNVQNEEIIVKPEFFNPCSIWNNFTKKEKNRRIINELKQTIMVFQTELAGIEFDKIILAGCSLGNLTSGPDVDMTKIKFRRSNLEACDIHGVNLTGSRFYRTNLSKSEIDNADLTDVKFIKTDFNKETEYFKALSPARKQLCTEYNASFFTVNLQNARFLHLSLAGVKFEDVNFNNAKFVKIDFDKTIFEKIDFCGTNFNNSKNLTKAIFKEVYYLDIPGVDDYKYDAGDLCHDCLMMDKECDKSCEITKFKFRRNKIIKQLAKVNLATKQDSQEALFFFKTKETKFPDGFESQKYKNINPGNYKFFEDEYSKIDPQKDKGLINVWDYFVKNKKLPPIVSQYIK